MALLFDGLVISPQIVTPAKAGVQNRLKRLDSRLRRDFKAVHRFTYGADSV